MVSCLDLEFAGHTSASGHVHLLFLFLHVPPEDVHMAHCLIAFRFFRKHHLLSKALPDNKAKTTIPSKIQNYNFLQTFSIYFPSFSFLLSTYHKPINNTAPTHLVNAVCPLTKDKLS